ncbi:MAG: hypothetical protein CMB80_05770 [Flammeovirgaceae bacterium]|nr:hypothetical protein [Flammeovirgaceae bacterium]|tara:strand:+ start:169 stop:645 length:477 start_codon:yes stop_codon:yes gene_type:complete
MPQRAKSAEEFQWRCLKNWCKVNDKRIAENSLLFWERLKGSSFDDRLAKDRLFANINHRPQCHEIRIYLDYAFDVNLEINKYGIFARVTVTEDTEVFYDGDWNIHLWEDRHSYVWFDESYHTPYIDSKWETKWKTHRAMEPCAAAERLIKEMEDVDRS